MCMGKERIVTKNIPVAEYLKSIIDCFFLSCGIVRYAVQRDTYLPVFSSRR